MHIKKHGRSHPIPKPNLRTIADYKKFCELLMQLSPNDQHLMARDMARQDLFFLLTVVLKRKDAVNQWILDRCKEVEESPDGHLDLWSRGHYKSTIITFAKTIQDILASHGDNPLPKWHGVEITVGIFSCTRPLAKAFLAQIKREFETNEGLRGLFPDIIWENPDKDAPSWSLDSGIFVKRKSNPREATIEAWGLVDGQPTGKHFYLSVYDDVVTIENVRSPAMIEKTTDAWALSLNLGSEHGLRRYIGTRYHFNDSYAEMLRRGAAKERRHPATIDGTLDGEPVLMSRETLDQKRRDMGSYVFNCFPSSAPILMADFTEKPMGKIKVGDEVVGYTIAKGLGNKGKLVRTKVKHIERKRAEIFEYTFESGRTVCCTEDHKWFTGRTESDHHRVYNKLGFNRIDLNGLISVYDARLSENHDPLLCAYLSGLYDGEGSYSSKTITICQSPEHNPEVYARMISAVEGLGFDYGLHIRPARQGKTRKNKEGHIVYLRGGRQTAIKFLNIIKPAKAYKIIDSIYRSSRAQDGDGINKRDKLVSTRSLGDYSVYGIETETGNYVAYGYYTKNSQMLQSPAADESQGFKRDWLEYHECSTWSNMNTYILVDPANEKRKTSDYTAMVVVGLSADNNYYVLEWVRDKLSLTERADVLFMLHRKYKPLSVGYEKYGMQSDIAHIKYLQNQVNYRFKIIELGGILSKVDRVRKLIPLFEAHRIYLPISQNRTNIEGKTEDLVQAFINEEYLNFPVSLHDDMLDALARITDEDMELRWPKLIEKRDRYTPKPKGSSSSAWSV